MWDSQFSNPGGLANPANRAEGGLLRGPGGPTGDKIPLWGSDNEYMIRAAAVDKYGVDFFDDANAMRLAQGGPIIYETPDIDALRRREKAAEAASLKAFEAKQDWNAIMMKHFGSFGVPGHFSGTQLDWVFAAEAATGTPTSWTAPILRRIMFESGGNPNAINLTDSNAMAGDPSRGLMQTIMSTFMGNHQSGTSWNIYDPVANIAAAINYIKGRYGSIFAIDPPVQGYDDGGPLPPGKTTINNRTGDYEYIFNKQQMQSGVGGVNIQHFHLQVDTIKDVQHLLSIIHGIPQAVRSM